jgi:hypothetical protein
MDVRKDYKQAGLEVGAWYVGVNYEGYIEVNSDGTLSKDHLNICEYAQPEYGAIAQYVGNDEFYDEGCDEPTRMQDYEYIMFSHAGKM